ncbi:MAG: phenylalanine--tRNA ligase subunit beta [Buchnera aphidicola (Ceratovacuna japonica)]
MKISKNWIMEWINFPINFKKICNHFNKIGIEVKNYNKTCISYKNLLFGKIILKKKILLDKKFFFLYFIKIKNNFIIKIFSLFSCNVKKKVIVSISKNIFSQIVYSSLLKYHYYESKYFICSPFSIGISNVEDIPVKLSKSFNLNKKNLKKIEVYDNIVKLNVPYNRIEEFNIIGICREIYAINNMKFKYFKNKLEKKNSKFYIKISVVKKINNYRYLGRKFSRLNFNVKTPYWISKRLSLFNIKSKNIIYDIINYVYIETGEHFHFFLLNDLNKKIFIKILHKSKKINIFKKKFFLKKNSIVLSNKKKILIFGKNFYNYNYNFNNKNVSIFLGSLFLKENIFKNYKKNNVNKKKIDYFYYSKNVNSQLFALKYITKIILMICSGSCKEIVSLSDIKKIKRKNIFLYKSNITRLTGISLNNYIIENLLTKLGYKFFKYKDAWKVFIPYHRNDILIEEDIISDIIRFYGIYKISSSSPSDKYNITNKDFENNNFFNEIKYFLISKGYNEVLNYSFTSFSYQKLFTEISDYIKIKNPISNSMSIMRSSLFPGLLENFIYNINRQNDLIKIFELGLCYFRNKKKYLGFNQKMFLSCLIYGNYNNIHFDKKNKLLDFYALKGDLEYIFEILRLNCNIKFIKKKFSYFSKEISSAIFLDKKCIGKIGKLNNNILKKINFDKNVNVFLFEICIDNISKKEILYVDKISEYPKVKRDISIIVLDNIKCYDIIKFCKKIFYKNLIDIYIFDIYYGENISNKKKSISIRLIFQSFNKTLKEIYIDTFIKKNIILLKKKFNAIIKEK